MSYNAQLTAAITLTAAEVKSLIASPTLLVSGRAGAIINLLSCLLVYQSGGTPFGTIQSGDAISPVLGKGQAWGLIVNDGGGCIAAGFIDQSVTMASWLDSSFVNNNSGNPTIADLEGASLYLTQFNQNDGYPSGTDWAIGNGTLTVFIRYTFVEG